jgi:hypothetical protein
MKKIFLVFAVAFTMFSVSKASNSLETETKVYQIVVKEIIHDNPNYMKIHIYADKECRVLIEIKTINKENGVITTVDDFKKLYSYLKKHENKDVSDLSRSSL